MGKLTIKQQDAVCSFLVSERSRQLYPSISLLADALGYSPNYIHNVLGRKHQKVTEKFATAVAFHFGMKSLPQLFGEAPMILTERLGDVPGYREAEASLRRLPDFSEGGPMFWEQIRRLQADWAYSQISELELHTIAHAFYRTRSFLYIVSTG